MKRVATALLLGAAAGAFTANASARNDSRRFKGYVAGVGSGPIPEGWPRDVYAKKNIVKRCYARGVKSVCIDLMGFLVNGKIITGGHYEVSVDHRGYEPRSTQCVVRGVPLVFVG